MHFPGRPELATARLIRGTVLHRLYRHEEVLADFRLALAQAPPTVTGEAETGALVAYNNIEELCDKAAITCGKGLCRSAHRAETPAIALEKGW